MGEGCSTKTKARMGPLSLSRLVRGPKKPKIVAELEERATHLPCQS